MFCLSHWEANNPLAPLGMSWIPPAAAADVLRLFLLRRYGGVKSIAREREREREREWERDSLLFQSGIGKLGGTGSDTSDFLWRIALLILDF